MDKPAQHNNLVSKLKSLIKQYEARRLFVKDLKRDD